MWTRNLDTQKYFANGDVENRPNATFFWCRLTLPLLLKNPLEAEYTVRLAVSYGLRDILILIIKNMVPEDGSIHIVDILIYYVFYNRHQNIYDFVFQQQLENAYIHVHASQNSEVTTQTLMFSCLLRSGLFEMANQKEARTGYIVASHAKTICRPTAQSVKEFRSTVWKIFVVTDGISLFVLNC